MTNPSYRQYMTDSVSFVSSWAGWSASFVLSGIHTIYKSVIGAASLDTHAQTQHLQAKQMLSPTEIKMAGSITIIVKCVALGAALNSEASWPTIAYLGLGLVPEAAIVPIGQRIFGRHLPTALSGFHMAKNFSSIMNSFVPVSWIQAGCKVSADTLVDMIDSPRLSQVYQNYRVGPRILLWTGTASSLYYDIQLLAQTYQHPLYITKKPVYMKKTAVSPDIQFYGSKREFVGCALVGEAKLDDSGFPSIIITAPRSHDKVGMVYTYPGGTNIPSSVNLTASIVTKNIYGEPTSSYTGSTVATVKNFRGDGYDAILTDTTEYNQTEDKVALIYTGPNLPQDTELENIDGSNGVIFYYPDNTGDLGSALAGVDINCDGHEDAVIGQMSGSFGLKGRVFIVYGGQNLTSPFDLSQLGDKGITIEGIELGGCLGAFAANIGDVSGKGWDALAISATRASPHGIFEAGSIFVLFARPDWEPTFDLSTLDGTLGFRVNGFHMSSWLGTVINSAGYMNSDLYGDFMVASSCSPEGLVGAGAIFVINGQAVWPALFDLSTVEDGTNGFIVYGEGDSNFLGSSMSPIGDWNGDNFDDVIWGATGSNDNKGTFYVLYGSDVTPSPFNISDLVSSGRGFKVQDSMPNALLGSAVGWGRNLTGDGRSYFVVSAPGTNGYEGIVYVLFQSVEAASKQRPPKQKPQSYASQRNPYLLFTPGASMSTNPTNSNTPIPPIDNVTLSP